MGPTALATLALLHTGIDPNSETVKSAFGWIRQSYDQAGRGGLKTYSVAVLMMALEEAHAPRVEQRLSPADRYGTAGAWPQVASPRVGREQDVNRFVHFRPDRCIACSLCTRYCNEVEAVSAITLAYRGAHTTIATADSGGETELLVSIIEPEGPAGHDPDATLILPTTGEATLDLRPEQGLDLGHQRVGLGVVVRGHHLLGQGVDGRGDAAGERADLALLAVSDHADRERRARLPDEIQCGPVLAHRHAERGGLEPGLHDPGREECGLDPVAIASGDDEETGRDPAKGLGDVGERRVVVDDAVSHGVAATHEHAAVGRADGHGADGVVEAAAFARQAVDARRGDGPPAVTPRIAVAQIISHDHDQVWTLVRRYRPYPN